MNESTSIIDTHCPHCGKHNPCHAHPDGSVPGDGDLSICWGCRGVAVYVAGPFGLSLRQPTDEELARALAEPEMQRALAAMAASYTPLEATKLRRPSG